MKTLIALVIAIVILIPVSLAAHHAFAAEFDRAKPVKVQGSVVKVEWTNPHIWIYIDAKDDKGAVAHWQCEGGSPNTLTRQGWTKESLKQGDQVTIDGYRAKDGSNTCNSSSVTLAGGKKLFAGSSAEGQQ
jgi:hypothetical protein